MAGYDTVSLLTDTTVANGVSQFGTPNFFIRYFNPCPDTSFNSSSANANAEARKAWDFGTRNIGVISAPGDTAGSSAEGHADAQTFAASLQTAFNDVAPMLLPSNDILFCWLDLEASQALSSAYWSAWAGELMSWNWERIGVYPLWPGLYCAPCSNEPNCSSISLNNTLGIWSSTPECFPGASVSNPPAWKADSCLGCGVANLVSTYLWQFAEPGACHYGPNVDMDLGAPGFNYGTTCFSLQSRP
jgi:hypothetical protein